MVIDKVETSVADRPQRVNYQWESPPATRPERSLSTHRDSRAFTVAVSREVGTPGAQVARELGQLLHWDVYDHELLERVARKMDVRTNRLESIDEKRCGWFQEAFADLISVPMVNEFAYVHQLVKTVLGLGLHGGCVVVGRGACHILPAATTLRIRLVAPLKHRILEWAKQRGVSTDEAERQVRAIDWERRHFVKDHFQKDPADPSLYDLVVNSATVPVTECAAVIMEVLRRRVGQAAAGRLGDEHANLHGAEWEI
jgi:cytidylate kinase-like protein